ncbi:MAG: DUF1292 domain-containing protein [Clostridia bacterium]|nr:DUF1292 domain-containing protein [Clostridia bacterium]
MMQEFDNIVTLVDESGKEVRFDHLCTIDYEDKLYALLMPIDEVEGVEEDEVIILQIVPGEGDEDDSYVGVEDEETLDAVFNHYLELMEAEEEADEAFEDAEDPEEE